MAKKSKVFIDRLTGRWECYRCGRSIDLGPVLFPTSVHEFCAIMDGFIKAHRKCVKTEAGSDLERKREAEWKRHLESKIARGEGVDGYENVSL